MNKTIGALALLAALALPSTAFAGGWTQAEGKMYGKFWATGTFGEGAFDLDGEQLESEPFGMVNFQFYGEYGLRPDLTLLTSLQPIGIASISGASTATVGKMMVGARQRLHSSKLQVAVEGRLGGAPGWGGESDLAPYADDYEFKPAPARSYLAEWDLQMGLPISSIGWVTAGFGPRWAQSDKLSHAVGGNLQVGFGPFAGFIIDAHFALNWTFDQLEVVELSGMNNTRYVGFGLGASYWASENFAIHAGFDGALYAASNAYAPAISLGAEFRN